MRQKKVWIRAGLPAVVATGLVAGVLVAIAPNAQAAVSFPVASLDGNGNNATNPTWGAAGTNYLRVGPVRYANGTSTPSGGPNTRYISNRIFSDNNQNVFSDHRVTQWGWTWGQFLDHTFGLAAGGTEAANIPFNASDPLESFTNTLGSIPFNRDLVAAGTGTTNPRQQVNTENSYIDAEAIYGNNNTRLEWLREGSVDGNVTNNNARLLLTNNYLPRRDARGNAATAPVMDLNGRLTGTTNVARVAGDVRANENLALTATQTLFAREHNRIVSLLPNSLSEEDRFQIARRVLVAEQQYITYNEFLPAMGVTLPAYTGYQTNVNAALSNEFAVVGYRAHSQIHGEFEFETAASRYSAADLANFTNQGLEVEPLGDEIAIAVPLNVAFFNPDLLPALQLGPMLSSLSESQYRNDEQFDNQLRSVLFQIPVPGNPACVQSPDVTPCFRGVVDLAAIDIERARDHGIGTYNQLRQAYGLPTRSSFTAITGESTEAFPADPLLTAGNEINDPNILDYTQLNDLEGGPIVLGGDGATSSVRRTTIAARLRAIYGNVNNVDAFTGMVAEPHLPGREFGELQLAIWTRQFRALRDGDRFFYGNDQGLNSIRSQYGIDFRSSLAQIIARNTDTPLADMNPNIFLTPDDDLPPAACTVVYTVTNQWPGGFQVNMSLVNNLPTPLTTWTLRYPFATGQTLTDLWNGVRSQNGTEVTVVNANYNGNVAAGGTVSGVGFNGTWDNTTNAKPPNFTLNNRRCANG